MKVTLKNLNEKIANPLGVELIKGKGYFYLWDLPGKSILSLTESNSIYVYSLPQLTWGQWKEEIENLVKKAKI